MMSGFDITMYRDMFVEEADELFESADNVLLAAENNGSLTDDEMGQLFRDVHTLKGSGASVELAFFAEFTHDVENMMDKLRNHEIEFIPEMAGTLIDGLDVMKDILQLECDGNIDRDNFTEKTADLLVTIRAYINGDESEIPAPAPKEEKKEIKIEAKKEVLAVENNTDMTSDAWGYFGEESILSATEDDSEANFGFFDEAEEITPKAEIKVEEIEEIIEPEEVIVPQKNKPVKEMATSKKAATSTIRVNLDKIDLLMNNVGDLVITNAMLTQYSTTIQDNKVRTSVLERLELLERHIREMQDSIMSIRMVPMESIYSKFPKVVRDISKKLNKKIDI